MIKPNILRLFPLALATCSTFATQPRFTCDVILAGERRDDPAIVAYVGLSSAETVELLNTGSVSARATKLWPYVVEGRPAVQTLQARRRGYEYDNAAADEQWARAATDAWARTVVDVLAKRRPELNLGGENFLSFVRKLDSSRKNDEPYSPKYRRIFEAAQASTLPKTAGTRVQTLAKIMNVAWPKRLAPFDVMEREVAAACADLPARAGTVLALDASALGKISWSERALPHLKRIDLEDLIGIEPLSPAETDPSDAAEARSAL